jgi:hypothetical protein
MGGGAQASTARFAELEPWSAGRKRFSQESEMARGKKPPASAPEFCLDSAVVVIDGMTPIKEVTLAFSN